MTISAVVPRIRYVGSGTTGPFGFGWRADNKNQIKVVKVSIATGAETVLTVDVDYTVAGILNPSGGSVTLTNVLGNGTEALVIVAELELEQGLTLSDHNDFPAPTVEQRLDWMTRMFQRSYDLHGRSLVLYETDIWGQGEFNGGGNRIANVAEPVGDNDVVTLAWHEGTWVPQLNAIVANAEAAADEASTYLAGVAANAAAAAASAANSQASAAAAAISAAQALASANAAAIAAAQPGTSFIALRSNPYASLQNVNKGSTDAADNESGNWMWARMFIYGDATPNADMVTANRLQVNDQVDNGSTTMAAFGVIHRIGGGNTRGTKHAIEGNLGVTGAWAGHDTSGYRAAVAMQGSAYADVNVGGADNPVPYPPSGYRGNLFGGNDHPRLTAGATWWSGVYGREVNVEIAEGANAWQKIGLSIIKGANDFNQGDGVDVALMIVDNLLCPVPWRAGLQFGSVTGKWPFDDTSVMIGTQHALYPTNVGNRTVEAAYGVDFRDVVFSQYAFASNNFSVNDAGYVLARRFQITEHIVAVNSPVMSLVQRWDDEGADVAFAGFSVNILDDSSSDASILFDVQKDSVSQMKLNKFGSLFVATQYTIAGDVVMARGDADILALRRSTNPQKFQWMHTYGSPTDYMGGQLETAADSVGIRAITAGAGADNVDVKFVPAGTGLVRFGVLTANADAAINGYITIKAEDGTTVKLATIA